LCHIPKLLRKKYIPLAILNSDYIVMSRENRNFHLRPFAKGGTLHIRQGDPLSHYLFILWAETLSVMLHQEECEGKITGIPITRGGGLLR
jgi:hypothetical protein